MFEERNSTLNCSSQVWSEKRCVDGANCIKVNNRAYATKITDVVETCTRDRRDVVGEGKDEKVTKVWKISLAIVDL